jgi:uncharacterized protein
MMLKHGRRIGVEFMLSDAPKLTPSMRIAMADLKLDQLLVVYPGRKGYTLAERIDVIPATRIAAFIA